MNGKYTPGRGAQGEDSHEATAARQVEPLKVFVKSKGIPASVRRNPFDNSYDERTPNGLGQP